MGLGLVQTQSPASKGQGCRVGLLSPRSRMDLGLWATPLGASLPLFPPAVQSMLASMPSLWLQLWPWGLQLSHPCPEGPALWSWQLLFLPLSIWTECFLILLLILDRCCL